MCASVISGCDPPPVLELAEHVLDIVALFVEGGVVFDLALAVFLWRDTKLNALAQQGLSEPVGVITIRKKVFSRRQRFDNQSRAFEITHLPL